MSQRITCETCGKQYKWKPELVGRKVRCACGESIRVTEKPAVAIPATVPPRGIDDDIYELNIGADGESRSAADAQANAKAYPAQPCPSCRKSLKAGAVVCIECGFNRKLGEKLDTETGRAVKQAGEARRGNYNGQVDGFFGRMQRSWEFAKISYGILWDFKQLIIFPILSGIATVLVLASFILPLWGTGTLEQWGDFLSEDVAAQNVPIVVYVTAFAFYFCCYFVISYFNTALAACAMRVCAGEAPTLGYGLSIATKRFPQLVGWALVAATVGILIKSLENVHEKLGRIFAAIFGAAWTILTYFVVPVLAVEGVGPFKAVKESVKTLRDTWGNTVLGNFSMGLFTFLITLPVYALLFALMIFASNQQSDLLAAAALGLMLVVLLASAVISSAADVVFKSLLYNYATGKTIPEEVDEQFFASAFAPKK